VLAQAALTLALCRSFTAAFLICAHVRRAEAAVMQSISAGCLSPVTAEMLIRRSVVAAMSVSDDRDGDAYGLPPELQRVVQLPALQRRCYALRVLLGWSREDCAQLMKLSTTQVDNEVTCAATVLAHQHQLVSIA